MMPGTASTGPLRLTDRLVIALDQLRSARADGDPTRELAWQTMMDRLLDYYAQGRR